MAAIASLRWKDATRRFGGPNKIDRLSAAQILSEANSIALERWETGYALPIEMHLVIEKLLGKKPRPGRPPVDLNTLRRRERALATALARKAQLVAEGMTLGQAHKAAAEEANKEECLRSVSVETIIKLMYQHKSSSTD